jgi:hypothetical protein
MKEDIFSKLHYHSGLVAQGCWNELDEYDREAIIRFGDLIVKEAAEFMNEYADRNGNDLLEHFGVKK